MSIPSSKYAAKNIDFSAGRLETEGLYFSLINCINFEGLGTRQIYTVTLFQTFNY